MPRIRATPNSLPCFDVVIFSLWSAVGHPTEIDPDGALSTTEWQNQARTTTLAFYLHVVAEIIDQLETDAGLVDALALGGYFHIRLGQVCDTNPRLG